MGTARSWRESALIRGPVSALLALGAILVAAGLIATSALGLLFSVPVLLFKRLWKRLSRRG